MVTANDIAVVMGGRQECLPHVSSLKSFGFLHGGHAMRAYALIIGLTLAGQIRAGEDRYPAGSDAQPPAASGAADAAGSGSGSGLLPLTGEAQAGAGDIKIGSGAAGADADSSTAPPASGSTSPFRQQGAGSAAPRSFSPIDSNNALPLSGAAGSVPAQYQQRSNVYATGSTAMKPSSMMRAMLVPPTGTLLAGQPVKLMDLVSSAGTRAEQAQRVEAYWDLCSSVADYYLGLRELGEMQRFGQGGGPMWAAASTEMNTRNATALRAARASQMRLASLMGRGPDFKPLPADSPHCASYNTHHDQIFPQGGPAEAKELDALLPLRYKELQNAAENVQRSEQLVDQFANGRGDVASGLNALELLALNRRAFVQIARDYNRRIARYSELASPGEIGAVRLTSMLIKVDAPATATRPAAPIKNKQSSTTPPPKTFVEESGKSAGPIANTSKRDEKVQAASGEEASKSGGGSEHSLLVAPKSGI